MAYILKFPAPFQRVITPANFPTVLTPVLGTFAATGLAATGAVDGIERVTDGGLESWVNATNLTNWTEGATLSTVNREAVVIHGGSFACRFDMDGANTYVEIAQAIAPTVGVTYSASVWARVDDAAAAPKFKISLGGVTTADTALTAAYAQYQASPVATSGAGIVLVRGANCANRLLYFDDVSVQQHRSLSRFTLAPHGRVDVPITTPAAPAVVPFGIVGRLAWPNCWYLRVTPNTAGNDLEIVEVNAGVMTSRAATDLDFAASTEYTFGLQCMGNVIKGFVNNVEILNYTDPSGLWTDVPYWGIMDSAWPNGTFGTITGRA